MASFDDLPADQKAVLSMVLKQGRSFDQIAALLNIDRAGVRQRALEGFDALGPDTPLEPLKRALITDYLLGQLPPTVASNVAISLAATPPERAWARIVAAEISPLATHGLPEIPAAGSKPAAAASNRADTRATAAAPGGASPAPRAPAAATSGRPSDIPADAPRSSRRGGAILIAIITLIVIVVIIVISGGSKKHTSASTGSPSSTAASTTVTTTGTGTTSVQTLHKIEMVSPSGSKTIEGGAAVVRDNGQLGLVVLGEGLPANNKNAYGVWLFDSKTQASEFLGFYGYKVAATGKTKGVLEAEVKLPSNAKSYNELLLTLETQEKPTKPGTIVLEGAFAE